MLSTDIKTQAMALAAILHDQNEANAAVLRIVRDNLFGIADQAEDFESTAWITGPSETSLAHTKALSRKREKVRQQLDAFWDKQEIAEGC